MPSYDPLLLAFSWREKLASMSWLEMVLWVGMISLTLALLILMGTRWGQVRPVSKCVALSVFAHLLFLCYAYGTHLNNVSGSLAGDPFVTVSYIAPEEAEELEAVANANAVPADEPVDTDMPVDLPPADVVPLPLAETTPPPADAPQETVPIPDLLPAPEPPPEPVELPIADTAEEEQQPAETVAAEVDTPPQEMAAQTVEPTTANELPGENPPEPSPEAVAEAADTQPADVVTAPAPAPVDSPPVAAPVVPQQRVDGQEVPEPYRLRSSPDRKQFAFSLGANEDTEAAVHAALAWLAAQQHQDGRWDASEYGAGRETKTLGQDRQSAGADADTGISGLALLAFLGAGHTHLAGEYHAPVQHGLEFLLRSQHADGSLTGDARLFERMYCHGIATLAVGEAYALTGDSRLLTPLRRAVGYSLGAQDRNSGGWRYQPGDRGDMSQFGWQVMSLRSAQLGGLDIPAAHRTLMLKFLDSASQGARKGLASYRPGERVSRTMTAEALTCRLFLRTSPSEATMREATDFVLQELPGQGEPNLYYWYYATLALFQTQGRAWDLWNQALQQQLLPRQHRGGPLTGSWDTRDVWGGYGGRIYTTAMATLCLEVYYRYLPIYDH